MFSGRDAVFSAFEGFLPEAVIETLISVMLPALVLVPSADEITVPTTFVGGTPYWSADAKWPVPPLPASIEELANRGGRTHAPHITKALEDRLPYAFIAQVDLEQIAHPDLPDHGRLLFFYDVAIGPWDMSKRSAKVIWDQSAADDLVEAKAPEALIIAEATANKEMRNYVYEPPIIDDATRQMFLDAGFSEAEIMEVEVTEVELPPHVDTAFYIGPKEAVTPAWHLQSPVFNNLEWDAFARSVLERHEGALTQAAFESAYGESEVDYRLAAFQLMGLPYPVQDDPRYNAATLDVLGKQWPTQEEWQRKRATIIEKADDYQILFQVSLADWLQDNGEGQVYFIISKQDLEARNFDQVIAVYQQT